MSFFIMGRKRGKGTNLVDQLTASQYISEQSKRNYPKVLKVWDWKTNVESRFFFSVQLKKFSFHMATLHYFWQMKPCIHY
jgi:hypothetical protein